MENPLHSTFFSYRGNKKGCCRIDEAATPDDLFDFLDLIQQLKEEGRKQREIAEVLGWSRKSVTDYYRLLDNIVPKVLKITREHQEGRGTKDVPFGTFNFTEGWFRNSGLYEQ